MPEGGRYLSIEETLMTETILNISSSIGNNRWVRNDLAIDRHAEFLMQNTKLSILTSTILAARHVAVDNADVASCAFVTNTVVENALSKLKDGNSAYHLSPYAGAIGSQQIANRSFMVSNNVPSNLTKGSSSGVCSALIYGNFSDLLIGLFGDSEILVDPYSAMQTGVTAVRILQAIDVKVRHAESFGAIQDITT